LDSSSSNPPAVTDASFAPVPAGHVRGAQVIVDSEKAPYFLNFLRGILKEGDDSQKAVLIKMLKKAQPHEVEDFRSDPFYKHLSEDALKQSLAKRAVLFQTGSVLTEAERNRVAATPLQESTAIVERQRGARVRLFESLAGRKSQLMPIKGVPVEAAAGDLVPWLYKMGPKILPLLLAIPALKYLFSRKEES